LCDGLLQNIVQKTCN